MKNRHSWEKEELIAYDNSSIAEQDEKGKLIAAKNEEKEETVERCWEEDMPVEIIAKITNLSTEEVKRIIEKIRKRK